MIKPKLSKVTPVKFPLTKRDNYVATKSKVVNNLKFLIFVESLFAINRIYLLQCSKFTIIISYLYCLILIVFIILFTYQTETLTLAHFVFKYILCIEYFLLIVTCVSANKNKSLIFFRNLNKFDEILNISKDISVIDSPYISISLLFACILYHVIEYILVRTYLSFFLDHSVYCTYVMMTAHDCEQIFFFILLRSIYLRLHILKAHIFNVFCVNENVTNPLENPNKVEAFSNNTRLDVGSLHRVYDLLHKCSEQLNSFMSMPMLLIFMTAGLSTIMLMKMAVTSIQMPNSFLANSTVIYLLARCCKYTALVVVPCYYSSITTTQVSGIRTVLHDAIHTGKLDKIERRKVKAFFQLTRENEFSYALGGIIRLDMSLPLSYMSLCTTYLVISIQFSKFFD